MDTLKNYIYRGFEPRANNAFKLADYFHVSIEYLLGNPDNITSGTKASDIPLQNTAMQLGGKKIHEAAVTPSPAPEDRLIPAKKVETMLKNATFVTEQNTRQMYTRRIQRLTDRIDVQFSVIILEALVIGLLLVCLAGLCLNGPRPNTQTPAAETTKYHITQPALATAKTVEATTAENLQPAADYTVPIPEDHKAAVLSACAEYGVDPLVAFAVMQTESCYQSDAENAVCVGYYQINTDYAWYYIEHLGVTGVTDPSDNIRCGIWYLGQLISRCDSLDLALMHYNLGNIADDYWRDGITSTAYTKKVRAAMRELAEGAKA